MTLKVLDVNKFRGKLQSYVNWNEYLGDEARDALKTVAGWLNEDECIPVVLREEYDRLHARFQHLMESQYIRSFDQVELGTGKYRKDIRLAIGPDEKILEEGLSSCAFCGSDAVIISQKSDAGNDGDFAIENTIICKCGAVMRGRKTVYKINTVGGLDCIKDGRNELIKKWNRRPV